MKLGYESLRGSDSYSFKFNPEWLKKYGSICLSADSNIHSLERIFSDALLLDSCDEYMINYKDAEKIIFEVKSAVAKWREITVSTHQSSTVSLPPSICLQLFLKKRFHFENTTSKYESKGLVHFKPVPLSPKNVRTSTVPPHQSR